MARSRALVSLVFLAVVLTVPAVVAGGGGGGGASAPLDVSALLAGGAPDELVLFAIPSHVRLDWSTPGRLLRTFVAAYAKPNHHDYGRRAIGHVFVLLRSSSAPEPVLTGMTNAPGDELREVLLSAGYGLGLLSADVVGCLEDGGDLAPELQRRCATGRIAWLRFRLSPATSARLSTFLGEYRARGCDRHYGGANRPRYGEGGGCSAFGVSFMELAGLVRPEFEQRWKVEVAMPWDLVGGPFTGRRVRATTLAFDCLKGARWAGEDEPHVLCSLWDPSLIFEWVNETYERGGASGAGPFALERVGEARGLAMDCRDVPTPEDPLWLDPVAVPNPYGRQPGLSGPAQD